MKKYLLQPILNIKLSFLLGFVLLFAIKTNGQITHTTAPVPAGDVAQGADNHIVYKLNFSSSPFIAVGITFTTSGNYTASDIKENGIKVYYFSPFTGPSDILKGQATSMSTGSGETISINFVTPILAFEPGNQIKIKFDVAETAIPNHTIKINGADNPVALNYGGMPTITNNQTDDAGVQTITGTTPPTPATLIANYTFCGNANDVSGNGHNGTAFNGILPVNDRFNNANSAYSFDGIDDVIDLGNWFTSQNFSVSMWLKPGSTQVQHANIIDNNHSGSSQNWVLQQDAASTNVYGFGMMNSGFNFNLTANDWQHLVLVKSATTMEAYINGVLVHSIPYSGGPINYSDQFLRLGNWGGGNRNWNGVMDDVKIYDGALSETEILAKYNQENTPTTLTCGTPAPVLVANYTFCNNANDTSPNVNNATVSGASLTFDRFGYPNSAYSFDGIDDYIEAPSNAALQLGTGDYSFSYWFKTNSSNSPLATIMKTEPAYGYSGIGSYLNFPGTGNVYVRSQNSEQLNTSSPAYNDNNWHYVTYTRQGNTQKLYVDNILKETNSSFSPANISNNKPLTFGSFNDGHQQFFIGSLDDIKIYSGTLTETDIAAEFNATSTAGCTQEPCPTITVSESDNTTDQCTGSATLSANGGTGDYTYSIQAGVGGNISGSILTGKGTFTIQATDANGCTGSVSITLTNNDTVAPTFTNCPADITQTADANCSKVVTWPMLKVDDNCSNIFPIPAISGFLPQDTFNNSHYYFSNDAYYWAGAKSAANVAGGHIVAITSQAEHDFIKTLPFGGQYSRIGLSDEEVEGEYKWSSGEPFSFSVWNGGEPNNGFGGNEEDYVQITTSDSKWNDVGDINSGFILEKSVFIITQTAGLPSGSAFPIGTTTNTFEVTDVAGNKSTCSFTVTINPSVTADISYTSTAICTNSGEKTVTLSGPTGGNYTVSPASGLSVDASTGTINTLNATPGNYTITYTVEASGTCPAITDDFAITVNAVPAITCPQPIEVCKNSLIFNLPNIPSGATVTVGGVANTSGTFDPSADWSAFNDEHGSASVPVVYTITNGNGCTSTCSFIILVKRLPNAFSSIVPEVNGLINGQTVNICKNSTEIVNILFGGGTGSMAPFTFTYTLNGVPQIDLVASSAMGSLPISTTTAGNFVYNLTKVKINTGCELVLDIVATVNILETLGAPNFSKIQPTCEVGTGSITINTLAAEYSFDNGENFQLQNSKSLAPGTYLIKIKDNNGCISLAAGVIINQQPGTPDAPEISIVQPTCLVSTATISIASPILGYEYFLNGNPFNNGTSTTGNQSTTYNVIARNADGCQSAPTEAIINAQPATPLASLAEVVQPTCEVATGSITQPAPNGFMISFDNGQTFNMNNTSGPLASGNYIVKIKSAAGCESVGIEYTINPQPASPVAPILSQTPANCSSSTGSITVNIGIGQANAIPAPALMYKLDNGDYQTGTTFSGVSVGSHIVTVKNDAGCTASSTITVESDLIAPIVTVPANTSVCKDSPSITLSGASPIGGIYSGTGVSGGIFTPNTVGNFTIAYTVTGSNGCVGSNFFTINVTPKFSVTVQPTAGSFSVCEGTANAGFQFVANGASQGATGFSVKYKLGEDGAIQTATTTNGIAVVTVDTSIPGNYTYYFIDAYGADNCGSGSFGSLTFTVKAKPAITCPGNISKTTDDPIVILGSTGTYTGTGVSLNGSNYEFNPATAGVNAHLITYTVTGENGCPASCTFTITVSASTICTSTASISYSVANSCQFGINISPTFSGTTGGLYSALPAGLNINETTGIINPMSSLPGDYIVSYTLAAGGNCAEIIATAEISINVSPTLAGFTAESGCQPLPIPLSFSGLKPNSTNTIVLGVTEVLLPNNSYGDRTITVLADPNGNGTTILDVSGYQTVEYKLNVKEVKIGDCILVPNPIMTANFTKKPRGGGQTVDITETAICNGGGSLNGVLSTVPNYQYNTNFTYQIWNITNNTMVLNGTGIATPLAASTLQFNIPSVILPAGSYQFRIVSQDIDGCGITAVINDNFTVLPTPELTATAEITNLDCHNSTPTGSINQTISGGSGIYTFAWSNNAISEDVSNLAAGNYSVTITDPSSCGSPSLVKNYSITKPNAIVVNAASITSQCNGNNGTASLSATGGNGGFSFSSNNGGTVDMEAFTGSAGTYTITATDSKGCTGTLILTISNCEDSDVICTTTQNGYGNAQFTACQPDGSSATVGSLMTNALNGSSYVFGLQANNRTFTLSPSDLTSNIYSMLSGVSNASSKFGLGGASYSISSSWSKVPLTNTGKIANNLFAHSMAMYFNLQNSTKLDQVALNSPILNTESTLNCGSETGSGVVSSYQLPTGVVTFLNNPVNGYAATVAGLFQLNNDALGGKSGLPNLSTLAAAADKVNKAFNGCRLIAGLPANTATFGTNIKVNEGSKAFDAPAKGGLYMTLIEGNPATGHILGVVEVGSEGLSGFAPVITNYYYVIMGTDPEGSRIPQAPAGYRIVSQIVSNGTAGFAGQGTQVGSGEVAIGTYNPQAGSKMAATENYQITFILEAISAPLPVRLISFTGKSTEKGNELNWKTSSEQNFSHYEVERSSDAKTFEMIGKVNGAGNTNEKLSYSFIDNNLKSNQLSASQSSSNGLQSTPLLGRFDASTGGLEGLYYRLKMVDLDGKTEFSKVIYLNRNENTEIKVYPNPAINFINIENLDGNELNIRVLDELGREILGQTKSNDINVKIPVGNISTGTYFIQIQNQKQTIYRKVVVNK